MLSLTGGVGVGSALLLSQELSIYYTTTLKKLHTRESRKRMLVYDFRCEILVRISYSHHGTGWFGGGAERGRDP